MINRFIKVQCELSKLEGGRSCCWGVLFYAVVPRISCSLAVSLGVVFMSHCAYKYTRRLGGISRSSVPCAVILADAATLQPTQKWQLECAQRRFSNEIYATAPPPLPAPWPTSPLLPLAAHKPESSAYVQINLIANKLPGASESGAQEEAEWQQEQHSRRWVGFSAP